MSCVLRKKNLAKMLCLDYQLMDGNEITIFPVDVCGTAEDGAEDVAMQLKYPRSGVHRIQDAA